VKDDCRITNDDDRHFSGPFGPFQGIMESETLESPAERYEMRLRAFAGKAKTFEIKSSRYSNLRLAIVLLGVASVFVIPKNNALWVCVLAAFLVFLVILFIVIVFRHQAVEEALSHARAMTNLNAEGTARVSRDWKALPNRLAPLEPLNGMLARDLDLFGPVSLFQLICTANTWEGQKAVAEILVRGIEQGRIPNRQAAVKELAAKLDFRVDNDVRLGPPGRILMVTGSNMSGKTPLLRSIGINVLLAKAGGPVCAKRFELPWIDVATSIRAMDSVSDGVSLFMAELSSTKVVVEAAHRASRKGNHPDKVHFQETFVVKNGKAEMSFDYLIREGEAQSRNAIALMKHIGLKLE
jgi:MutS domain V